MSAPLQPAPAGLGTYGARVDTAAVLTRLRRLVLSLDAALAADDLPLVSRVAAQLANAVAEMDSALSHGSQLPTDWLTARL